ncbi:MAG: lysophospholipid acyltransferase family protein, partial [Glaciecola sp.]
PKASWFTRVLVYLLDQLLGIAKMNRLYQQHNMQGLSKEAFADKLISILQLDISGIEELKRKIPKSGPVVIASNHPFGGIEGVILARAIGEVRPDIKVLANKGLGIFRELRSYFIFTNPLSEKDPQNGPSLRQCIKHVQQNGALLLFPAGRVSYYQPSKRAISEHSWNKIVGRLVSIPNSAFVPVFVSGTNSKWFYRLGRVYFRLRMLMLARELLNKIQSKVRINAGNAIKHSAIKGDNYQQKADVCRALSYAQEGSWRYTWPADTIAQQQAIATPTEPSLIVQDIQQLPSDQTLVSNRDYNVYFAYQSQAPHVVNEIARLREVVFREHNEGSGDPIDTDNFDATYTHLFIVNNTNHQIMGAYRMGLSDKLIDQQGLEGLYLYKMFRFAPEFVNRNSPCMEMGRSFLIPEFQGSYQGLLLLWRGIGAFAAKFPQYRTLYGTVSISKLYDPRSVKLIEDILIKPENAHYVAPRHAFAFTSHSEISETHNKHDITPNLSAFISSIESDGKDLPVLAKQYAKMGAKFHALGIDTSFNHTPGLLLSVHLPSAPTRLLKLYVGDAYQQYIDYQKAQ